MVYYTTEDEYYQDQPEANDERQMEDRLVEAQGYHVQDSVNEALIIALKPFAQPLMCFGQHELRGRSLSDSGSQQDQPSEVGFTRGASRRPTSSADILAHMAASVMQDLGYGSCSNLEIPETSSTLTEGLPSSASQSSDSDIDQEEPKPTGKHKHKSHYSQEYSSSFLTLSFDPENIIHPRSLDWIPCAEVAHYVQDHIGKGFDRDVRSTLRSECPDLL
ncbi:hypothetical protein NDU88_004675 [Pleurodeles waltl]|uniref:Uncharacterized protein n=1 Tax=Pleurodeles waltl TaxID=8319 RepID=A0AAV7QD81_PLEWA|nr:hypothetical protein NDU88_004675 [Pleurodeles waltl]